MFTFFTSLSLNFLEIHFSQDGAGLLKNCPQCSCSNFSFKPNLFALSPESLSPYFCSFFSWKLPFACHSVLSRLFLWGRGQEFSFVLFLISFTSLCLRNQAFQRYFPLSIVRDLLYRSGILNLRPFLTPSLGLKVLFSFSFSFSWPLPASCCTFFLSVTAFLLLSLSHQQSLFLVFHSVSDFLMSCCWRPIDKILCLCLNLPCASGSQGCILSFSLQ